MTAEQRQLAEADRAKWQAVRERYAQQEEQREQQRQQEYSRLRRAFRHFDEDSFAACPWRSQLVALIAVAADGPVTFACAVGEKRDLLGTEHEVLVAWPGEWSQHVFLLSDQDKAAVLALL